MIAAPGATVPRFTALASSMSAVSTVMSLIVVANVDVLFAGAASLVAAATVAVLAMAPDALAPTMKVLVMTRVSPETRAPRLQGNGVVQAPELETNVSPAGVASFTVTTCATEGPAFVTLSVYEIVSPGRASASPIFTIDRSAPSGSATTVIALEVLFSV